MAGDSKKIKTNVCQLALDTCCAEYYDVGGNDMFELMKKFALF